MSALEYNFEIEQGSSFKLTLVYKDKDGNVIDLTDWCARLIWTTQAGAVQTFSTTNTDFGIYKFELVGVEGKLNLMIPAEMTNSYTFDWAKYDLELQSDTEMYSGGGKNTIRILYGVITLLKRNSGSYDNLECPS